MSKLLFLAISFCFLFVSCKNNVDSTPSKSEVVELKLLEEADGTITGLGDASSEDYNILIDSDYYISIINSDSKKEADKELYKLKSGQDQFKYYYIPLNMSEAYKTFLILEDYESESAVWMTNYTPDMRFIDAFEVYCDNAEGCWQTTSEINLVTKKIRLTDYDCYADSEKTIEDLRITSEGKFEK